MLCRTDELTDQATGTVYHCGSACAALANRYPILYPDQLHRCLHLPPPGGLTRPLSPALRPLRNYKHSFHTKSGQRSPFETSPARFLLQITTHSLSPSSPSLSSPTIARFTMVLFSKFLRLEGITFDRARGYICANVKSRRKSFIKLMSNYA